MLKIYITLKFVSETASDIGPIYDYSQPVNNNYPWDPKFVILLDKWSLFRGSFKY